MSDMSDEHNATEPHASTEPHAAAGNGDGHRSAVRRVLDFCGGHPKTSLVIGAGVSAIAGAELLAAALVGGAITLALGRLREPS
jgi:hypothetical protein